MQAQVNAGATQCSGLTGSMCMATSPHHTDCAPLLLLLLCCTCRAAKTTPVAAATTPGGQPQPPIGALNPDQVRDKVKAALIRLANNDTFVNQLAQELRTVGLLQ